MQNIKNIMYNTCNIYCKLNKSPDDGRLNT